MGEIGNFKTNIIFLLDVRNIFHNGELSGGGNTEVAS